MTVPTSATKPTKNPKRVAVGKATAGKTRLAREAPKRKTEAIIVAYKEKETVNKTVDTASVVSTTQWLMVVSIIVSQFGLYYKREEIETVLEPKKKASPFAPNT